MPCYGITGVVVSSMVHSNVKSGVNCNFGKYDAQSGACQPAIISNHHIYDISIIIINTII